MSPVATVITSSAHLDLTSSVTVHLMNSTATHQPSPVETVTSYIISDSYLTSFAISQNMSSSISISPSHPSDPSDDGEDRRSNEVISIGIMVAVILLVTTAVTIIVVAVLVVVFHQRRCKKGVQHKEQTNAGSVDNTIFNPGIGTCV